MSDYKSLHFHLFNAVTNAIDALQSANYAAAQELLIQAQQATEEIYINAEE